MKYQNKVEIAEATRWFKNGDHPLDDVWRRFEDTGALPLEPREGKVVRYFRHPGVNGLKACNICGKMFREHGWIDSGGQGQPVCPGNFVVTTQAGYLSVDAGVWLKHYVPYVDPKLSCVWKEDEGGMFGTQCGHAFVFNDGGPKANDFKSCPYCGRALVEARYEPEPEALPTADNQQEKGQTMDGNKGKGHAHGKPEDPATGGEVPAVPIVPGTVLLPNRIRYEQSPSGLQQHQEYDLPAGVFITQATTDGTTWQNTGEVTGPITWGLQVPLTGAGIGWQLVAK